MAFQMIIDYCFLFFDFNHHLSLINFLSQATPFKL